MLAGIAKQWAAVDGQKRRARIVLLSATPVDVAPVLEKLGFDRSQDIRMISERVTPDGGRALHGDVVLDFVQADGVMGVLDAVQYDLVAINSTNKALIIYDSLRHLRADERSEEPRLNSPPFPSAVFFRSGGSFRYACGFLCGPRKALV